MSEDRLLPADSFVVLNKTILSDQDRNILTILYQPIIGQLAISLYFTLWSFLDRNQIISTECTHHHLMTCMRVKLDEIMESREKLEGIGLLKVYIKRGSINTYVYEMYSPLSAYEFLNNPVLSISLYNNIGDTEYEKTVSYFKIPKVSLKDFENITHNFNQVFESTNISTFENMMTDIKRKNINNLSITSKIDLDSILTSIPIEMLNPRSITKDVKELIYRISFIYDFDDDRMSEIIRNSITDKKTIDKALIKMNSKKFYRFENSGKLPSLLYRNQPEYLRKPTGDNSKRAKIIYQFETTTPFDFLASKYNGSKPSNADLSILSYLLLDMNLNPGVVNVLVDYVLKINNNKLNRSFIEIIASQWAKSKIETVESAMKIAEKEYKNRKKYTKKERLLEQKPSWFEQDKSENVASKEEVEEIEKMLSEFR